MTDTSSKPAATRRAVLKGAGTISFMGVTVAAAAAPAGARPAEIGENCLTILYSNTLEDGSPVTFDYDYYRDHHLTLIMELYAPAISRFELIRPQPAADGAPPPQWAAVVNIYIADQAAFDAAGEAHSETLIADVPNFTNASLVAQPGVIYGIGEG